MVKLGSSMAGEAALNSSMGGSSTELNDDGDDDDDDEEEEEEEEELWLCAWEGLCSSLIDWMILVINGYLKEPLAVLVETGDDVIAKICNSFWFKNNN